MTTPSKPRQFKLLIISADKSIFKWRSLKTKLRHITNELNTVKNGTFTVEVQQRDLVPAVYDGRITNEWFDSISHQAQAEGYHFVMFHFSMKQHTVWGVKPTLRGSAFNDIDGVPEAYFWADEKTLRMKLNQFIQTCLHEIRHLIKHGTGRYDDTHAQHADGEIKGSFAVIDMTEFNRALKNQQLQVGLAAKAVGYVKQLFTLRLPPTLHKAATKYLGRDASPADLAPDLLGCAESVCMVIRDVLPDFPIITGTWTLYDRLENDKRFKRVIAPMPGTIVMSPTGEGSSKAVPNGHVGIHGTGNTIMSSDSRTGLWEKNFTDQSWRDRYGKARYPIYYYDLTT